MVIATIVAVPSQRRILSLFSKYQGAGRGLLKSSTLCGVTSFASIGFPTQFGVVVATSSSRAKYCPSAFLATK